ncbi:reverse transcriptase, partial [Phytophthora palmivora]
MRARTRSRQQAERETEQYGRAGSTHTTEQTFGFVTQNVNAFGATEQNRNTWFGTFGVTDQHGRSDVTILQETHVNSKEVLQYEKVFATRWGFRQGPGQQQLSFWSPSNNRKGGVAVLIDPYGSFKNVTPVLKEHWTPHFIAVQGYLGGKRTVVCNVYAPHLYAEREEFYKNLQAFDLPKDALVLVGGDFNCTLNDEADRTYHHGAAGHDSPRLRELLSQWGVLDPVAIARPSHWAKYDLVKHHNDTHTYHYTISGKGEASSRLDRWYVSAETLAWVAAWNTVPAGAPTDHHAAKLHLHAPDDPIR